MSNLNTIFMEICDERQRQDHKWGGHAKDDANSPELWRDILLAYVHWMWLMLSMRSFAKARNRAMQVATVAVALMQSIDRKRPPIEIPRALRKSADLAAELAVADMLLDSRNRILEAIPLLDSRNRILEAIPPCETHGSQCISHAIEWVAKRKTDEAFIQNLLELLDGARNYVTDPALRADITRVAPPKPRPVEDQE